MTDHNIPNDNPNMPPTTVRNVPSGQPLEAPTPPPGFYHVGSVHSDGANRAMPEYYPAPKVNPEQNSMGITALILGLVGLLFAVIPLTGFLAVILGIIGVILGMVGIKRCKRGVASNKKMSIIGTVISAVALVVGIIGIVIVFSAVNDLGNDLEQINSDLQTSLNEPVNQRLWDRLRDMAGGPTMAGQQVRTTALRQGFGMGNGKAYKVTARDLDYGDYVVPTRTSDGSSARLVKSVTKDGKQVLVETTCNGGDTRIVRYSAKQEVYLYIAATNSKGTT